MSVASLIIGIVSVIGGFTFVVPLIGLILGIVARGSEPSGRTIAAWGIAVNVLMLVGWILVVIALVSSGALVHLFTGL